MSPSRLDTSCSKAIWCGAGLGFGV
jgi:hypothetical protein